MEKEFQFAYDFTNNPAATFPDSRIFIKDKESLLKVLEDFEKMGVLRYPIELTYRVVFNEQTATHELKVNYEYKAQVQSKSFSVDKQITINPA